MTDKESNRYPSNQAYISKNSNSNRYTNLPNHNSEQSMRASVLAERVHDLEEQLISIATALNEDGKENRIWQQQIVKQHNEVSELLQKRQREIQNLRGELKKSEDEKKQLKNSLFRQNQQFQNLQKQFQQARTTNSRMNGKQLQEKVLQLNDQISTLLVKIQQLIEENNQHISYIQQLQRVVNEFKANQDIYETNLQRLTDENTYLKEEIKEVENMNIYQQTQIQNKYIEQLEEAKMKIQTLKNSRVENTITQGSPKKMTNRQSSQLEKENNKLRAQIHNLQEQLLQQREVQRSVKKKYEEKLNAAEAEAQKLNQQITKLKHANRKLQSLCAENSFALEQLQKQKKDAKMQSFQSQEHYKNIILRLQTQKQEINLRLAKAQIQMKYQQPTELYSSLLREAEFKIQRLKQELNMSETELVKSKNAVKEYSELAKRWEEDYRILAKSYEEGLAARRQKEERSRMELIEFEKQKQKYWQTVRKCKITEQLYKEIEEKLKIYQQSKTKPSNFYDKESSDLIRLQNSALKQQISQLRYEINQLKLQLNTKATENNQNEVFMNTRQLNFYKQRQLQLQREVQMMKTKLNAELNNSKEADSIKIRELNDQLTRVNKMLNQRQMELDSFKEKYTELQAYLNRRQESVIANRHHPQYTRLKNQFVVLQRKLMETQLYYKNNIQNANYEIESLKVENMHHRKKIQQLLQQLSNERNTMDYGKINRSLQLSQLKIKELEKQLQFSQIRIKQLNEQLRKSQNRSRKNSQHVNIQTSQNKNATNLNNNYYLQSELNHQNNQIQRKQINGENDKYHSSSYEQILKWKQEIKQSRTNFSKKWANQFNTEHLQNPHLWYPLKEQISS